eukprot:scpid55269/ scgid9384/ 
MNATVRANQCLADLDEAYWFIYGLTGGCALLLLICALLIALCSHYKKRANHAEKKVKEKEVKEKESQPGTTVSGVVRHRSFPTGLSGVSLGDMDVNPNYTQSSPMVKPIIEEPAPSANYDTLCREQSSDVVSADNPPRPYDQVQQQRQQQGQQHLYEPVQQQQQHGHTPTMDKRPTHVHSDSGVGTSGYASATEMSGTSLPLPRRILPKETDGSSSLGGGTEASETDIDGGYAPMNKKTILWDNIIYNERPWDNQHAAVQPSFNWSPASTMPLSTDSRSRTYEYSSLSEASTMPRDQKPLQHGPSHLAKGKSLPFAHCQQTPGSGSPQVGRASTLPSSSRHAASHMMRSNSSRCPEYGNDQSPPEYTEMTVNQSIPCDTSSRPPAPSPVDSPTHKPDEPVAYQNVVTKQVSGNSLLSRLQHRQLSHPVRTAASRAAARPSSAGTRLAGNVQYDDVELELHHSVSLDDVGEYVPKSPAPGLSNGRTPVPHGMRKKYSGLYGVSPVASNFRLTNTSTVGEDGPQYEIFPARSMPDLTS